jgi:hypothetical protein
LKQSAWDERNHEAFEWLKTLDTTGASRAVLLADESRIRYSGGDYAGASRLAKRSLTVEKDADVERLMKLAQARQGITWAPNFNYWQDNQERQNWDVQNNVEFKLAGNTRMNLNQSYASYVETSSPTVHDTAFGAGIIQPFGLFHTLTVTGAAHTPTDQAMTYSAFGQLRSKWTDYLTTDIEGGRTLADTSLAIVDNIFVRYGRFRGIWTDYSEDWTLSLKARTAFLTDDNRELAGETQVAYRFFPGVNFKGVYRFSIDDMKDKSPDYYSPNGVILNQLGIQYETPNNRPVQGYMSYLPGAGTDRVIKPEFDHDLELGATIKFNDTTRLVPSFSFTTTPSYNRESYTVTFSHQF